MAFRREGPTISASSLVSSADTCFFPFPLASFGCWTGEILMWRMHESVDAMMICLHASATAYRKEPNMTKHPQQPPIPNTSASPFVVMPSSLPRRPKKWKQIWWNGMWKQYDVLNECRWVYNGVMCPGGVVLSRTWVPTHARHQWWHFAMTMCGCGAMTVFGTRTTITGFAGPIPWGCWIVLMVPVGTGGWKDNMGHLIKLVPMEWDTERDAVCKGEWGSHMWEWQCRQLRLAHGLRVPEWSAETSRITQPADRLKTMGLSTLVGLSTSLKIYCFLSSPLCCSFLPLTSVLSSPPFLAISALDTADLAFCMCFVFMVIVPNLIQVVSARVAFRAFPAPLVANVGNSQPRCP